MRLTFYCDSGQCYNRIEKGGCGMVFSSATFLFVFLPVFLLFYFLLPRSCRNYVLLFGSLIFYYAGVQTQVFVMLCVILMNYAAALVIHRFRENRTLSHAVLVCSLLLSFSVLFYFKYFNFIVGSIASLGGKEWEALDILLPIGISFYLFQTVSYTVDVYRGDVMPRKNPFILATYVTMFPQLVAGPIVRYRDVEAQLDNRKETLEKVAEGIVRFAIGLSKKVILANTLAELSGAIRDIDGRSVLAYWIWAVAYTLTIYFDFSGYSDMAIGLGKVMGFDFLENFNYPYVARSITEFFRRWHISLSTWFRDYVYIPLGGNRKGKARLIVNLLVVWTLTGLWHGAAWNFVLWGLLYAVLLIAEKLLAPYFAKTPAVFKHSYVLFFVVIGFVLFDAMSLSDAAMRIGGMFGIGAESFCDGITWYLVRSYGFLLLLAIAASLPLCKTVISRITATERGRAIVSWGKPVIAFLLFVISVAFVVDSSFNPFIYFRF